MMKKSALLVSLVGLTLPAYSGAQQTTSAISVQTKCGTVCGAGAGTVLSASPGSLASINIVNGTTAGFAVAYDATTIPADGALDPTLVRWCLPIAANTGLTVPFQAPPKLYYGLSVFVSSTSCTTKAAVTYGFVTVQVRYAT